MGGGRHRIAPTRILPLLDANTGCVDCHPLRTFILFGDEGTQGAVLFRRQASATLATAFPATALPSWQQAFTARRTRHCTLPASMPAISIPHAAHKCHVRTAYAIFPVFPREPIAALRPPPCRTCSICTCHHLAMAPPCLRTLCPRTNRTYTRREIIIALQFF